MIHGTLLVYERNFNLIKAYIKLLTVFFPYWIMLEIA